MRSFDFAVKDFNFGVGGDAERRGRRLEADGLVKACLKDPLGPVHQQHCRRFIYAKNAAQSAVKAKDIVWTKPELTGAGWKPQDTKEAGLGGVLGLSFRAFHASSY
jgi:hypothetical protein